MISEHTYEYRFPDVPKTYEDDEGIEQPTYASQWNKYTTTKSPYHVDEVAEWLCYLCENDIASLFGMRLSALRSINIEIRLLGEDAVRKFHCQKHGYIATEITEESETK